MALVQTIKAGIVFQLDGHNGKGNSMPPGKHDLEKIVNMCLYIFTSMYSYCCYFSLFLGLVKFYYDRIWVGQVPYLILDLLF